MKPITLLPLALLLTGCAAFEKFHRAQSGAPRVTASEGRKLDRICEEYFERYLRLFPVEATSIGDHRYDNRLGNDVSEKHRAQQRKLYTEFLGRLSKWDRNALTANDGLTYDVFKRDLEFETGGTRIRRTSAPRGQNV